MKAVHATLMLADISGYTAFVGRTELEHSSHIVAELLDVLATANRVDFTLAEVEGDALFLYREGVGLTPSDVVEQCAEMFVRFHERLAEIEQASICTCGACQTASGLGVKFIVHGGLIRKTRVAGFLQLTGIDVIVAHRLLKCGLPTREYVLMTEASLARSGEPPRTDRLVWTAGETAVDGVGGIPFQYASLDPYRELVPEPPPLVNDVVRIGDSSFSATVERPMHEVYHMILDVERRARWIPGSTGIDGDGTAPRLGSRHECRFEGLSIDFEAVGSTIGDEEIVLVEEGRMRELDAPIRDTFVLRAVDPTRTVVTIHVHLPEPDKLPLELREGALSTVREEVQRLKVFCESEARDPQA